MLKIKDIEINGFWGNHSIKTSLHNDVNIFIGRNGTGKTTLINLLQAILTIDLELLYNIQFSDAVINLKDSNNRRKIEVKKTVRNLQYNSIEYKIGSKKFSLPFIPARDIRFLRRNPGRYPQDFYHGISNIKDELSKIINVSYLSVSREKVIKDEYIERRKEDIFNSIDNRLEDLIGELRDYQLQLETDLSKHSKEFQENVLKTMLFNEEFDRINLTEPIKLDIKKIQTGLKQAYKGLGLLDEQITESIEKHIDAIKKASESIQKKQENPEEAIYANDITPITLLRRTNKIIELSNKLEKNKNNLFSRLNKYIILLNTFQDSKKFNIQDSKLGGLTIFKDDNEINISQLSSGEKQLIILLTETLLQKEKETLFIADEPELSLHIEWQRKVISSICQLNPNSQIIVATHSPEIVGKFKTNTINMERIING